jgi:carboxylesterase type B
MFFSVTTSLLLIALLLASTSLSAPLFTTTIKTLVGDFVGLQVEYQGIKVDQFLGIPFGVIPNRFEVAQPAPEITNFVATKQPPGCIQANVIDRPNGKGMFPLIPAPSFKRLIHGLVKPHNGPNLAAPEESQSEDCLKLNIFRPNAPTPPGGYAVMFWIYGGAFAIGYIGGSKELNYYDGTSMAANQNVIIVEANYRLSGW